MPNAALDKWVAKSDSPAAKAIKKQKKPKIDTNDWSVLESQKITGTN